MKFLKIFVFAFILHSSIAQLVELSHDPNNIHFYLYPIAALPDFNQEIVFNDESTIQDSLFQPGHKTVFIVHGFRSNVSSEMPQWVKNAYLNSGLNYNYIIVSWGALSTPLPPPVTGPFYSLVALTNIDIVGTRIGEFILWLNSIGYLAFSDVHMIGHSLGAHASGYAGMYVQQNAGSKLARITGLDPAGPLFTPPIQARNLGKSDADFVDVIHTNAGVLGDKTNDGHVDFWPNGGTVQTGCGIEDTGIPQLDGNTVGRCSHWFSYKLYSASLTKNFEACKCDNILNQLLLPLCLQPCNAPTNLGFNCPTTARGVYYLTTTNPP